MNQYQNYDWYRGNEMNLLNPTDGFLKGNMFKNLYNPYKNYKPANLIPQNEQESLLYELSSVAFASHELNLYLDLHPEDQSMFTLFQDYQSKMNHLIEQYEKKYGPLTVNSKEMKSSFEWVTKDWPWEGRNV